MGRAEEEFARCQQFEGIATALGLEELLHKKATWQEMKRTVEKLKEEKEKKDACSGEGEKPGGEKEGKEPTP